MEGVYPAAGYFACGMPFNRLGNGPRPLLIVQGLLFENKPQSGWMVGTYKFLARDYTTFVVLRKPNMPAGYTMQNMADDYAELVRTEFGGPIDVLGVSTGGSIVQHLAADHPDLVRRLVIHSSAYTLSEDAKRVQLRVGELAEQGDWKDAAAVLLDFMFPHTGAGRVFTPLLVRLGARLMSLKPPASASDLVITVRAEDKHDFKNRLREISAPTLVIAGDADPFYTETLFRETAEGIPHSQLILYRGMRHPAHGKQFNHDVLAFLKNQSG